jgi:hypothetical protein
MAKGGGADVGPTKRGKGLKIMAIVDRRGLPLSVSTHAANHHEVRFVQICFDFYMIEAKPENLIVAPTTAIRCIPIQSQQARHARWAPAEAIRKALLRVGSEAAPDPLPMGVLPPKFSRLRPTRLPDYPLQAILR